MIKAIKFASVPVSDQDRALAFYTTKLGFRILTDQQFGEKQRWIELSIPGAETGVVLFTPDGHEDRIGTFLNTSWGGVEFAGPPKRQPGGTFATMKDSEGNQIVLSSR